MRLRSILPAGIVAAALLLLACGGGHTAATPTVRPAGATSGPTSAGRAVAATPPPDAAPTSTAAISTPTAVAVTPPRAHAPTANLSLSATLSVSLEGTGGSYTYSYTADGVPIALENDGTFASTAPIAVTLALTANGCSWDLHLVNPQIEVTGSITDDGSTLRIASIRVSQDDVAGGGDCANGAQAAPEFTGIGAGTINLSTAMPIAIAFGDGAGASWPRPGAVERYPRSVTAEWHGALRVTVPGN